MTSHPAHPARPRLYKYNTRKRIEDLTQQGRIFVGTLRFYRTMEARAGSLIPDRDEGRKTLIEEVREQLTRETYAPRTRQIFGIPPGAAPLPNCLIRGNRIVEPYETPNLLWLYCLSERLMSIAEAREVMDPEYDAVAVVHDIHCFGHLLGAAVNNRHPISNDFFVLPMEYRDREYLNEPDDGIDPSLIKPLRFQKQSEARLIYQTNIPIGDDGMPLECPGLVAYCRMLPDDEIPKKSPRRD